MQRGNGSAPGRGRPTREILRDRPQVVITTYATLPKKMAGGAAAAVETGVPLFMMSMLIRAGLPSRRAAMAAIKDTKPVFATPISMRAWLESDVITAYTDAGNWPTPETAALWARFRTEALSRGIQEWSVEQARHRDRPACRTLSYHHRCGGRANLARDT